ncbi:MAG: hypothetical protein ACFE9C_01690 [Candidatus Hodarchaeota archaeon]
MGFKKIDHDELKTKISTNFLGIPIREGGKLVEKNQREMKIESSYIGSMSEVLILNEEFMEFDYYNNGIRKAVSGNGNISIFNNSVKDRIWDANLQFSGSQFDNQEKENSINLGIFEPSSNKILKYEIVNSDDLPDLIKLNETIEILSEEITHEEFSGNNEINAVNKKHYLLVLGKENKVKFFIDIQNVSNSILENIKFKKLFVNNFYDLTFNCSKSKEFKFAKNSVECIINNLNPGEKAEIIITAHIFPKKKEDIKSGKIELTYNLSSKIISGVKINYFSAYSHAMHAIEKTEKNDAPNHWECSLNFENHSDFKLKLNSVLIYDKSKTNKILDLDFSASGSIKINPRGKYKTENFEVVDEKEPTFSRKVEYSVDYRTETHSMITTRYDESIFKLINITAKKKLPEEEIKSFEESTLNTEIIINNHGTVPIKGLRIIEKIPEDFLPPKNTTDFTLYKSSGKLKIDDIELILTPDDDDQSHEHTIEVYINLKNDSLNSIINPEDFLELKYPLKAVTPNYQKDYDFPVKVYAYYPMYEKSDLKGHYILTNDLSRKDTSSLKISHKRRKLMIGKQIFPGRTIDEFAIYIIAKNGSNIKLSDVDITDTFPSSFELISSNIEHKINKSKNNGEQKISFKIDSLLPYQEKEIMYYLKSVSGKEISQSELESFFIG